ncbi:MAG: hypothetical protein MZW92_19510 [Comamonadaceae bacterium]|nr:hypothetical protein [Comamonadaceae bacterium]
MQNFNEQACILAPGRVLRRHDASSACRPSARSPIFGLVVAGIDGADPALAPAQPASSTAKRSSACWPSRAAMAIDARPRRAPAPRAALPALALLFNAFVWGVSWWPFRAARRAGPAPAVGHRR